jgi:hypothetical protein
MTFYRYETDVNSMGGFDQFENFVHTGNMKGKSVDVGEYFYYKLV